MNNDLTIVFVHLFKCGGTALIAPALRNYTEDNYAPRYNLNIKPTHSAHVSNLSKQQRQRIRFISGHFIRRDNQLDLALHEWAIHNHQSINQKNLIRISSEDFSRPTSF